MWKKASSFSLEFNKKYGDVMENCCVYVWNDRGDPLRWPRNTLCPQEFELRQQAAVAR
jgi:hypothetical protein